MAEEKEAQYSELRQQMVREQIEARNVEDARVLSAMRGIPRHCFVPENLRHLAYEDRSLPLGPDQSISQPFIVALMLESVRILESDKVLEIGTGSGYETAILCQLAQTVYSIELDGDLLAKAEARLSEMKYTNLHLRSGDGFEGWSEEAPFDVIVVSAAPSEIPRDLVRQLAEGGRMVLPFGEDVQELVLLEKTPDGLQSTELGGVRFVPMKSDE